MDQAGMPEHAFAEKLFSARLGCAFPSTGGRYAVLGLNRVDEHG